MKKILFVCLTAFLLAVFAPAFADGQKAEIAALGDAVLKQQGAEEYICYPVLLNAGPYTEAVNSRLLEKAKIQQYQNLRLRGTGSTGLRVDYEATLQGDVLSLVFSAKGKMLSGPPGHVYYPMMFDLATGEEIPFSALFQDIDGACATMESIMETEMEGALSDYLENRSLFPLPYDRFTVDETGGLTLWYEKDQLSFLSGRAGAVYFRFSQLEPYYNMAEGSIIRRMTEKDTEVCYLSDLGSRFCLGWPLEEALAVFGSTVDSEYYPGGACYEVEDARLRGALLLTDEDEETVTGLLTGNMDDGLIVTGRTTLQEADALLQESGVRFTMDRETAEMYRVCAGESALYKVQLPDGQKGEYTLYADEEGIIQFIRLVITE